MRARYVRIYKLSASPLVNRRCERKQGREAGDGGDVDYMRWLGGRREGERKRETRKTEERR